MNKKILLVDISIRGHRLGYLRALRQKGHVLCLLPEAPEIDFPCFKLQSGFSEKRTPGSYFRFLREIRELVKREDIDIVHLLCGDALYRFFGLGLSHICAEVIVTFHHMLFTPIRKISILHIFRGVSYGVVHTEHLLKNLKEMGIANVRHIEYPVFGQAVTVTPEESRRIFQLPPDKRLLVIIGTQYYKGLDILLEALNAVSADFHLLICGPERAFDRNFILEKAETFQNRLSLVLRYLDDVEYQHALNAADIVVLPYRFEFDGASGPLADSTVYRKEILASSHGSLGRLVQNNHLGETFETENPGSLAKALNHVLETDFVWDSMAEKYRESLTVSRFVKSYWMLYSKKGGR